MPALNDFYLLDSYSAGSGGKFSWDELISSDGKSTDNIREIVKNQSISRKISDENFNWVGGYSDKDKTRVGVLSNRTVFVIERNHNSLDFDNWSLVLEARHPGFLTAARFLGENKLLVVEADSGQLTAHIIGEKKGNIGQPPDPDTIPLLHPGTCAGHSFNQTGILPDGRQVQFDTPRVSGMMTDTSSKNEISVRGSKGATIRLESDTACVQLSRDWTRLLLVRPDAVEILNSEKTLQTGSIEGSVIDTIRIPNVASAFFVDDSVDKLITTDGSNSVWLWRHEPRQSSWSRSQIYKGDNLILHAEPDLTGSRLILIESTGGSSLHGLLYSIGAQEIWYDLGGDYKFFGAAFAADSKIITDHRETFVMQPLSRLVTQSEAALSFHCRPPTAGAYQQSPCWLVSRR